MNAHNAHTKLVVWISFLIFFSVLNETMFNVSTPNIALEFGLSAAGVSWVMTIFMVFFGIGSVIYGKLADIYSLRRLIEIGVYIYCVGSILGFFGQASFPLVVLGRAIQGIGASAIPALTFVVVARNIPVEERGRVFGFITSVVSVGIGIGPIIGGLVSSASHWAWLFLVPVFILIAIPFLRQTLPEEGTKSGSLDLPGAVLIAATVGALVLFLNFSQWPYGVAFVALLAAFIYRIYTAEDPFIQPALFRNLKFRNGVWIGFLLFSVVIGIFFLIPQMLSKVHAQSAGVIGLILFPGAISAVFFGPISGSLADRRGNGFVVSLGLLLLTGSMVGLAVLLGLSPWVTLVAMLACYIGFTLFQTAMINDVSQALPPEDTGIGMGIFNLVSIISGAVGTALVGKIIDSSWLEHRFLSASSNPLGFEFSNILLVFAVLVVLAGMIYQRTFGANQIPQRVQAKGM